MIKLLLFGWLPGMRRTFFSKGLKAIINIGLKEATDIGLKILNNEKVKLSALSKEQADRIILLAKECKINAHVLYSDINVFQYIIFGYNDTNYSDIIHIENINSHRELLKELGSKLNFPKEKYLNWDLFYDCFIGFAWLRNNTIIIHGYLNLKPESLRMYLNILCSTIYYQYKEKRYNLKFLFPSNQKDQIESMLHNIIDIDER